MTSSTYFFVVRAIKTYINLGPATSVPVSISYWEQQKECQWQTPGKSMGARLSLQEEDALSSSSKNYLPVTSNVLKEPCHWSCLQKLVKLTKHVKDGERGARAGASDIETTATCSFWSQPGSTLSTELPCTANVSMPGSFRFIYIKCFP